MSTATKPKPKKTAKTNAAKVKPEKQSKPKKLPKGKVQELLDGKLKELANCQKQLRNAEFDWEEKHAAAGEAKKYMEKKQAQFNQIAGDCIAIKSGNYTPPLGFKTDDPVSGGTPPAGSNGHATDVGAAMKLESLEDFGATQSKLAAVAEGLECKTVGDFEKRIREDAWWPKKCKGVGDEAVNKLMDSLMDFRKKYPVPSADEPKSESTNGEAVITRGKDGKKITVAEMVNEISADFAKDNGKAEGSP